MRQTLFLPDLTIYWQYNVRHCAAKKVWADAGAWGYPVGPKLLMSSPHQQSD
jgi:hypothetical protein